MVLGWVGVGFGVGWGRLGWDNLPNVDMRCELLRIY